MVREKLDENYDVIVVGYGPVGRMLALLLGVRGHRVAVVERQREIYFLPRAVHLDDEIARVLQAVGLPPTAMPEAIEPYDDFYEWRAADRSTLTRLDWRGRGPSGWNVSNFFNQPQLERALDERVRALSTVDVVLGAQAVERVERPDGVDVSIQYADGTTSISTAAFVVGADGANSIVRQWIGGDVTDLGYFHDWLVVDLLMKTDALDDTFSPPAWQLCDPSRPTTLVPGGPGRRRFEFMRLPHETAAELGTESAAWALLEPWGIGRDEAQLERHVVYTFQAKWVDSWQRERLFIAGDAAHLMPPFAGQGLCSGLRDAANLAWKLDLALDGRAGRGILDSYTSERVEHVRHFIEASMALAEVICLTDDAAARDRDEAMRAELESGIATPPRPLPRLGAGIHRDDAGGGELSVQGVVEGIAGSGLFDDVVGSGAALIVADEELLDAIGAAQRAVLETLGVSVVALGTEARRETVVDSTGLYGEWLSGLGAVAVLVRPDFYIFGVARSVSELDSLVDDFADQVQMRARV